MLLLVLTTTNLLPSHFTAIAALSFVRHRFNVPLLFVSPPFTTALTASRHNNPPTLPKHKIHLAHRQYSSTLSSNLILHRPCSSIIPPNNLQHLTSASPPPSSFHLHPSASIYQYTIPSTHPLYRIYSSSLLLCHPSSPPLLSTRSPPSCVAPNPPTRVRAPSSSSTLRRARCFLAS